MKKLYYKFTKKYWSMLSYDHARKYNFIVQYGIFKNLKMNDKISWGKGDIGSKIYGIYENKIQQKLKDISKPILIDIGAADGFFAIGCLKSKICDFCYAFEETKKSRENLNLTAKINNVKNKLSIMGEVTKERLDVLRIADKIFIDELVNEGLYDKLSQAFVVYLPVKSVGVVGDGRRYEDVLALRAVKTVDFMTATWADLPYDFIGKVSNRIVNEISSVSRVVYDCTGKPPATIEWE